MRPLQDMVSAYALYRIASGAALVLAGITCLLEPAVKKEKRSLGWTILISGTLFLLSALDPVLPLPYDVGNMIVTICFYILGKNFTDIALFLLHDEQKPPSIVFFKVTGLIGVVWTSLVCLLPFLDYVFHLQPVMINVEDAHPWAPFHLVASLAAYALPLYSAMVAIAAGYVKTVRLGKESANARRMFKFFIVLFTNISLVMFALAFQVLWLYRLAFTLLQSLAIVMYLYAVRCPDCLAEAREEIKKDRQFALDQAEADRVRQALEKLATSEYIYDADCSLAGIAGKTQIPPYRLSYFFDHHLSTSYSEWINKLRIEKASMLLVTEHDSSILDVAFACGYGSKSAFNAQFKKITGLNPRDFKKTILEFK